MGEEGENVIKEEDEEEEIVTEEEMVEKEKIVEKKEMVENKKEVKSRRLWRKGWLKSTWNGESGETKIFHLTEGRRGDVKEKLVVQKLLAGWKWVFAFHG